MEGDPVDDLAEPFQPAHETPIAVDPDRPLVNEAPAAWYGHDAFVIARHQPDARNLAVGADGLFWIADNGDAPVLHRSGLAGGEAAMHVRLGSSPADAIAIDGVPYWEAEGALLRVTSDSFETEKLTSFDSPPVDLAVRGRDLFVATADGCVQWLSEGADGFETLACGGGQPLALAVHEDGVWWGSSDGYIYRADDGVAEPVIKAGLDGFLAVDHDHVYWSIENAVWRAPRAGLEKPSLVTETMGSVTSLINDRFFLYFATEGSGSVWQLDKNNGALRRLSTGWAFPAELTLASASRLYWVDPIAGEIVTQRIH